MISPRVLLRQWTVLRLGLKTARDWVASGNMKKEPSKIHQILPPYPLSIPILKGQGDDPRPGGGSTPQKVMIEKALQDVLVSLGTLRGPVVKIAQMAAMIPDLLPAPYAQALLSLCASAPPMHWPLLSRVIAQEWGPQWSSNFLSFEKHPVAAASLGQVHRAQGLDGHALAVKIQYPAMAEAVRGDVGLFKILVKFFGSSEKSLNLRAFPLEWETRLWEELDYKKEAKNMRYWAALFAHHPRIRTPCVLPSLSTSKILVMGWLEGNSMDTALDQPEEVRYALAKDLFEAWYEPFYRAGMMHGDPHRGNMGWCAQGLSLYDLGCVRIFSPTFVQAFCHLYQGLLTKNPDLTLRAYENLGFRPVTAPIVEALNLWARFLLAPFLLDQPCYLDEVSCPKEASEHLAQLYKALKGQGGTTPPAEFLIFDRVAVILGALLIPLRIKAPWSRWMQDMVGAFSLEDCIRNQNALLDSLE